jgi:nucleoside-diphosphate-sugar epimerase
VLLEAGFSVTAVDALLHGHPSLLHVAHHPAFEFVRGDARDERLMGPLLARADVVVPLAAVVGAAAADADPDRARTTNVEAIRTVMGRRRPDALVIYPNTNSGYGATSGAAPCTEESPLEPVSLYGRTKVEGEALVLREPSTISLRLATVFGPSPRMRLDLLVNHFVHAAVTAGYLVVFEQGFRRNFVHVRDVADCIVHCIRRGAAMQGHAYNLGLDDANLTKGELACLVREVVPHLYVHFAEIGSDPDRRDYVVSSERLRKAGFAARRSLREGVRELVKAYRMLGRSPFQNA